MKELSSPRQMIEHLDRSIQGQADAKRALAVAVYDRHLARAYRDRNGTDLGRHHLLLIGPTWVGKTVMVKAIAGFHPLSRSILNVRK